MQSEPRQSLTPIRLAMVGAADKIQYRQQRFAATGEYFQLIAILGQHRFAGVDHIQTGVGSKQLP
ncbi:hypothetical protein D3C77_808740 [compost metagenome]